MPRNKKRVVQLKDELSLPETLTAAQQAFNDEVRRFRASGADIKLYVDDDGHGLVQVIRPVTKLEKTQLDFE